MQQLVYLGTLGFTTLNRTFELLLVTHCSLTEYVERMRSC